MSDEGQPTNDSSRELEREERRLLRLRNVIELHAKRSEEVEDFDPEPNEAA
jgi:hypothetical protein